MVSAEEKPWLKFYDEIVPANLDYPDASLYQALMESVARVLTNLQEQPCAGATTSPDCIVFTDDLAPIEWITNSLVLNYVLFSGMEEIQ